MGDQGRRDFAKGIRDGRLVLNLRLLPLRDVDVVLVLQAQSLEERTGQTSRNRPGLAGLEEVGDLGTDAAKGARQGNRREEARHRGADVGVRRDELLLGLAQIGPPLQKRRWQSSRNLGWQHLFGQILAARDRSRVAAEQEGQ